VWYSSEFAQIKKGDHVLDLGSGAEMTVLSPERCRRRRKSNRLDMTEPMVRKAIENCTKLNYKNVEFVSGDIENMPFEENLFDVIISNCVLNLVPDKIKAFSEIFRVLKPGAHFCVSGML
jgi:ubiquinone/menaquinone biosynthesis C-methylase UbiE